MSEQANAAIAHLDTVVDFNLEHITLGSVSAEKLGVESGTRIYPGHELWDAHQALIFGMSEGNGGW